ncbi:asparagine synthase-related protein [Saccharopolyspora sp. NFXS83]|uniref:asparagine synthase-related protein n=1 Tax=Saccharopolyspora sp. NFXS83 TaxID=2993560 RepID=UPI003A4E403B
MACRGPDATATATRSPKSSRCRGKARMRVMSHVHLARFLRALLDRKDRISMAVGLEVRVPFCDHCLVEYVHNAPWAMKSFDGREKSLLRAAARDVLPQSVLKRVKSTRPLRTPATRASCRRWAANGSPRAIGCSRSSTASGSRSR